MFNAITHSQIYVLDQDEALGFYVGKLGLEVNTDVDMGFMRWLTVSVPGHPERQILLEKPGAPAMSEETAQQVRELVTKGAMGAGSSSPRTTAARRTRRCSPRASSSPRSPPIARTEPTAACATPSATASASPSRSPEGSPAAGAGEGLLSGDPQR